MPAIIDKSSGEDAHPRTSHNEAMIEVVAHGQHAPDLKPEGCVRNPANPSGSLADIVLQRVDARSR